MHKKIGQFSDSVAINKRRRGPVDPKRDGPDRYHKRRNKVASKRINKRWLRRTKCLDQKMADAIDGNLKAVFIGFHESTWPWG